MSLKQYNKVIVNNQTIIDLTSDTVTSESLLLGRIAHSSDGSVITGSYVTDYFDFLLDNQSDVITDSSGNKIIGDIGYISMAEYKSMMDSLQATIDEYYRIINDYNILAPGFVLDSEYEKIEVDVASES